MYDGIILVYKNFLDNVKGPSSLRSGCEITFGISGTPAQHAPLITKTCKCVVLVIGPKNPSVMEVRHHRSAVLSDNMKKKPFADYSYQPSALETLRPALGDRYRKTPKDAQTIEINPQIIVFRTEDLCLIIVAVP